MLLGALFQRRPSEVLTHPTRRFGPSIAANIRRSRPRPSDHWHLDKMVISIRGGKYWLGGQSTTRGRCWISSSSADGMHKPQRNSW